MQRFRSLRGERQKEWRESAHLFVHFNVKAVGHLVILKHSRKSVNTHDHTQKKEHHLKDLHKLHMRRGF